MLRMEEAVVAAPRPSMVSRLVLRILTLGADPRESGDERARKSLLVAVCLLVLPAGVIWGGLYLAFDEPVAALFPWG